MKVSAQTSFDLVEVDRLVCQFHASGKPSVKGNIVKTRWGYTDVSKDLGLWTKVVRGCARSGMVRKEPERGLVRVQIQFYFLRPKSHFLEHKTSLNKKGRESRRPTTRSGDIDKLTRAILDALSKTPNHKAIAFIDDTQVVQLWAEKLWASDERGVGSNGATVVVEAI